MSPVKEPDFFAQGDALLWGTRPGARSPAMSWEGYLRLFRRAQPGQAVGEASTSYLYSRAAASAIHDHLPGVRLLAVLRDPTRRAYSNFLHCLRRGLEPLPFGQALAAEPQRIADGWGANWHYRTRGLYCDQLMRYRNRFPEAQLKLLVYESFIAAPAEFLRQVFDFLGVDPDFVPDAVERHNVSGVPKWHRLAPALAAVNPFLPSLKRVLPGPARARLRRLLLASPRLDPEQEGALRQSYREETRRLEAEFGLDLGPWR
jgi:hypothetical protein